MILSQLVSLVTCIEAFNCFPQNPLDVLDLYDIQYGAGMSLVMLGLILGGITLAIYVRNRSLPMLAILATYEFGAFGAIIVNKYVQAQFHIMIYVVIISGVVGLTMVVLRLVKE